ncbi:MAG TPA: hypothetical protein DDX39_00115 [Bacteroidales bacterium]|nr:MAG: hypothetical protein A2W98_04045 [Bacteroidetes bacterium GWF2_33_38]HBF87013.1 hypothetical protein [Bacteroidales bacterium]
MRTKLLLLSMLISINLFSQNEDYDFAYRAESEGYFTNLAQSSKGLVYTDNYASKLYLLENGVSQVLVSSPGCGRYYNISPDKSKIGYKHITETGLQAPAIYDLNTGDIKLLHQPVKLCGQVFFAQNGTIVYTIGTKLQILQDKKTKEVELGIYVNYTPISSDGKYVVVNSIDDQLSILNLSSLEKIQFTNNLTGYVYPKWSPDNKKIMFSSLDGNLYVFDLLENATYDLGRGGNANWDNNSKKILFQEIFSQDFKFLGSEIVRIKYNGTEKHYLTQTPEINEMNPIIGNNNEIFYHTYNQRKLVKANLNADKSGLLSETVLFHESNPLEIAFFNTNAYQQTKDEVIIRIPGEVPYVHQVYDTPTWHAGWGSCAPTTSVMAFAYFNRLPKWPTEVDHGQSWDPHTNDYGSYVADRYRFREVYYESTEDAYGTTAYGGYGYMWTGSYSPNSRMRQYIENHGITSNQLWTSSCTYSYTTTEIDLGYPHPLCNYLTSSGHLTLAIGYFQDQHTLVFNDPYGNKNTPGYPSYDGQDSYYDWPGYSNGYQNLDNDGSHGGIAWTVRARTTEKAYNDTLIDDNDYEHGFYIHNQTPSHQRYFRSQLIGYGGQMWWTGSMSTGSDVCYVTWTPTLDEAADYEVFAYIPSNYATAQDCRYKIHFNGGDTTVIVDQGLYSDEWVSLGIFPFLQGQESSVYLGDYNGYDGEYMAFDAIKFSKIPNQIQFEVTNVSCHGGSDGQVIVNIAGGQSPYTYSWDTTGTRDGSTVINGLSAGTYSVTVTDANLLEYIASVTVLQPDPLEITFSTSDPLTIGGSNGYINVTVNGGTPPYTYIWSNGEITHNLITLMAGYYELTVIDMNGCQKIQGTELFDPTCNTPSSLLASEISQSSVELSWSDENTEYGYLLMYQIDGSSEWDSLNVNTNNSFLAGLAVSTLYNWQIASICNNDTSVFATSNFTTSALLPSYTSTACIGKFTDTGGENNLYDHNEDYTFTIAPTGATKISISFSQFDCEAGYDTLWVYDGSNTSSPLIGAFNGTVSPGTIVSSGGSLTFYFWSDYATVTDGWVANWISIGGNCNINPTTEIASLEDWQTDNFTVDFTDTDFEGEGIKSSFYNLAFSSDTNWISNPLNGFLYDDFEDNSITDWTSFSGTWNTNSGVLSQADAAVLNTNLYIPINQDSLTDYLYSFKMKIYNDASSTTERAGLHFFVDSPEGLERGNSYLAWFRPNENRLQIWENINNVDYLKTNDYVPFAFDIWHDIKFYYSSNSGEISVYVDDILSSSWIDENPFKAGQYISLRTRYCKADFDNFVVYESRSIDSEVSVGENISDDIMAQNLSPENPSCKISSIVLSELNYFSATDVKNQNIDWSSPSNTMMVIDGLAADIDTSNSNNILSAWWFSSTDANSDIKKYHYAIGTSPGNNDVQDWLENGLDTTVTVSGLLSLQNGMRYYFSVKTENNAGLFSNIVSSDGQIAILLPSITFGADNYDICANESVSFINMTENASSYQWIFEGGTPNTSTEESPIIQYNSSGTFTVTLIAIGNAGTDTLIQENYINVNPLTVSSFDIYDDTLIISNPTGIFSNNSSNSISYLWSFGDGTTSTDQNPYHIYTNVGEYAVQLIAYSENCENDTSESIIHVLNTDGINDFNITNLNIYPNPFSISTNVRFENPNGFPYMLRIFDITGKELRVISDIRTNQYSLNRENLVNGVYFIELIGDKLYRGVLIVQE